MYYDLKRYSKKTGFLPSLITFLSYPGYRFISMHRLCNRFSRLSPVGIVVRIWFKNLQVRFGYQIPHTVKIGRGLFLGHFGNIVVNQSVVIGENCNVAQGVTIGNLSRGSRVGCPVIGDRVWVGANAVVVGRITVGNDVLIAPLSLVNFDVPDNSVVAGNPAQIISTKGSQGYIKNII